MHRALTDAHRINDLGALIDELFRFADKVGDHFIMVRSEIGQVEAADAKADDTLTPSRSAE